MKTLEILANHVHMGRLGLLDLRTADGAKTFLGAEMLDMLDIPASPENIAAITGAAARVAGTVAIGSRADVALHALIGEVAHALG